MYAAPMASNPAATPLPVDWNVNPNAIAATAICMIFHIPRDYSASQE